MAAGLERNRREGLGDDRRVDRFSLERRRELRLAADLEDRHVAVRGQTPALERVANRKIARAPDPRDADALALELRDLAEIGPRDDLERESVERRGEADEVGAGHVRVDVGDAAAREKVDLAREGRLAGAASGPGAGDCGGWA